jgi:hypothetical protein
MRLVDIVPPKILGWDTQNSKNLYSQPQTPCGRVFSRHTALRFLEMHQAFPRKRALSGGKILRPPSILGCEYRFLLRKTQLKEK